MRFLSLIFIIILLASCQNKGDIRGDNIILNPHSLVLHREDLAVKMALRNDSLYKAIERSYINEGGMTEKEAEKEVQLMIDKKLIMKPTLSYYNEEGRQQMELSYNDFKKYIKIIKDSVNILDNEKTN